jgi:glutamine amidotransferase
MTIGIVDAGIGNLGSLQSALYSQGWDSVLVSAPDQNSELTHLVLPGVGAFSSATTRLRESGLFDWIREFAALGYPVMGICLGMQLLADYGTEGGECLGLGLIPGGVLPLNAVSLRLPHVGWNTVRQVKSHPLLEGVRNNIDFYFVHSYRFVAENSENILAETGYGEFFPSIVANRNIVGAQFHPEKSQINGLRLINNFCLWDGKC